MGNKLSEESIEKIKKSNFNSKIKAQKRHREKLIEKREKRNIVYSNYRNKNAVIITEESLKHLYSKMIVSKVLKDSGCEILTEFPLKNSECDVITFDRGGLIIECEDKGRQESKANKKLEKYDYLIQSGIISDIFILDTEKDFTGNLEDDYKKIKERLGL